MQQGGLSLLTPRLKLCIECEAHLGIALLVCLSFSIETGNWLLWDFFLFVMWKVGDFLGVGCLLLFVLAHQQHAHNGILLALWCNGGPSAKSI